MKRKNHIAQVLMALVAMIFTVSVISCSGKKNEFEFENISEAVKACHKELSNIKTIQKADMEEINRMAARWIALQDTTYNIMMRDSTAENDDEIIVDFYMVSDSVRQEFTRLAMQTQRSMVDIIRFKIATAREKEAVKQSKDYQTASKFFAELDGMKTFPNLDETLKEYRSILDTVKPFTKEGQVLGYIRNEDRCFRSLMEHLYNVDTDDLKDIAEKTEGMFEALYKASRNDPKNVINRRMMTFLTMRFNRRIIQNAEAIISDVENGKKLSQEQAASYRWMLIQPYLTIDNFSMAYLTPNQEERLVRVAEKIPETLAYLDGKNLNNASPEEINRMANTIADYFLKIYINQAL